MKVGILDEEKAQGATEYLLMLAAVLVVIAAAVYYVLEIQGTGEDVVTEQQDNLTGELDEFDNS